MQILGPAVLKCGVCGAIHSHTDLDFVRLARTVCCSTSCVRKAMYGPHAEQELMFEPDTRTPEERRLNHGFISGTPRLCTVCHEDFAILRARADAAEREKVGAYQEVMCEAESKYSLLARFLGGAYVCGGACARRHLARLPNLDCKGFWRTSEQQPRCKHCQKAFSTGFAELSLVDDGRGEFCSLTCLIAFVEGGGAAQIRWYPYIEVAVPSDSGCSYCCCDKGRDLHWYEDDDRARALHDQAEGLLRQARQVSGKELDDVERWHLYFETDRLVREARAILRDKFPDYQRPFFILSSLGNLSPNGHGYAVFCSIEHLRAFFKSKSWHDSDIDREKERT